MLGKKLYKPSCFMLSDVERQIITMPGRCKLQGARGVPTMRPAELVNLGTLKGELAERNPKVANRQRYSSWREEAAVAPQVCSEDEASGHYY